VSTWQRSRPDAQEQPSSPSCGAWPALEPQELPAQTVTHLQRRAVVLAIKRGVDVVGSVLAFLVLWPLMLLAAVAIKLDSPGPVLFVQDRAGRGGRPFRILKFRSMVSNAEQMLAEIVDIDGLSSPAFKIEHDPRVTRVGRFLRRASIDELPQLWNVLKGEMSLVGPRPEEMRIVSLYDEQQRARLAMKPGITGPMQIEGRGALGFEERLQKELGYIETFSLWGDVVILAKTPPAVVRGKGSY